MSLCVAEGDARELREERANTVEIRVGDRMTLRVQGLVRRQYAHLRARAVSPTPNIKAAAAGCTMRIRWVIIKRSTSICRLCLVVRRMADPRDEGRPCGTTEVLANKQRFEKKRPSEQLEAALVVIRDVVLHRVRAVAGAGLGG